MRTREGIRFSNLKHIARSPAHYRCALDTPFEQTPAKRIGSLVHALLLGGDFAMFEGVRRGKSWDEFEAANAGRLIVSLSEFATARAISEHVQQNPLAKAALTGRHEVELFRDHAGRKLGGTLDVLGDGFVTDLKTTHDASPDRFPWQLRKLHYDAQLSWYTELARANGHTVRECRVVAVETKPPYAVTVFRLMPRQLEAGALKWASWLETLLVCESSGAWPEYTEAEVDIDIPDEDETFGLTGLDESESA